MHKSIIAITFFYLVSVACGRQASTSTAAAVASPEALKEAFLERRRANDVAGAMALYCDGKTEQRITDMYERAMVSDFALPITKVEITGITAESKSSGEYTAQPLGRMVLSFDNAQQGDGVVVAESFLYYAKQGDRYCFPLPVVDDNAPPPAPTPTVAELLAALPPFPPEKAEWNATPKALVRAFQADYLAWNQLANVRSSELQDSFEAMAAVERDYAKLLHKYVLPGFRGESIAFGDESSHDPVRERILSTRITGDKAVVRTEITNSFSSTINEYALVRKHERWYLEQVYFIDNEERYPGL